MRMPPTSDGSGYFAPERPRIFAHRGLATAAPENTLPSFAAAIAAGADYLETDVQVSRDGVAVLSHDPELAVPGVGRVTIAALTTPELADIDLGGAGIPTLADALAAFPGARFNIDVKADGAERPSARAVRDAAAVHRVLITSFSESRRRRTIGLLPGAATSASRRGVVAALAAAASGSPARFRAALAGVSALQVPERYGPVKVVTPRLLRLARTTGVEVHVWTVNDPAAMVRLVESGVDGIVTDRADLAAAALRPAE